MKPGPTILVLIILFSIQRCATVKAPMGGPKDTIPPVLDPLSSNPKDNSKNFKGETVTLNFDELVKIKDQKEIIITPRPGKDITILAKNKTVTIKPKNGWADSTTYSISFRDAVQDITESNPARNLHLAFSTGPVIDSLSISGTVRYALKEDLPDKATVAIFQSDTFNIFKHQPNYITETSKDGKFKISNLKPGRYHIYAFDDKNKNLKVDSQSELYGFESDTITLKENVEKINIYMLRVDSRTLKVSNLRHNVKLTKIKLNKPVNEYTLTIDSNKYLRNNFGDNQVEIDVYHNTQLKDSIKVHLVASDSLKQTIDTTLYVKTSIAKTLKEKFTVTTSTLLFEGETGLLKGNFQFSLPLKKISQDTMLITYDSALSLKLEPSDFLIDSITKQASFSCAFSKPYSETLIKPAALYFSKAVFISIEDDSSNVIKAPIPYLNDEETGKLAMEVKTEVPHYILQIVSSDYKVQQQSFSQPSLTFKNLPAGNYKIRAIVDSNNNGKWDSGNYYKGIEPEKIYYLKNFEGKYDFALRANWETGPYTFSF